MKANNSPPRRRHRVLYLSPLLGLTLFTLFFNWGQVADVKTIDAGPIKKNKAPKSKKVKQEIVEPSVSSISSSCMYLEYPSPERHTGLPYLGDVFASRDAKWVYFIGMNRGKCHEEFQKADAFGANGKEAHRFICVFQETEHVLSEFVHPNRVHNFGFIFRCRIPKPLRHLVQKPQNTTTLHVDLHSIEDLERKRETVHYGAQVVRYPSMEVAKMPLLAHLPVCHPVDRPMEPKQYKMTAMCRMKSAYALDHNKKGAKKQVSPLPRLMEWMNYHRQQGFDHFIIYDNDPEPHGQIEELLRPLVDAGLVSYRWFPLSHCYKTFSPRKGSRVQLGQMAASISALHRYGFASEFYAHMDVDEFFVPLKKNKSVLDIVQQTDPSVDALSWVPNRMAPCNGVTVDANDSILRKWKCITGKHYAASKLIMRSDRMLYFFVHYPKVTVDWTKPNSHKLNDKEGFLAHYRQESDEGSWWRDDYSGKIKNNYKKETHFMDHFLKTEPFNVTSTLSRTDSLKRKFDDYPARKSASCPTDLTGKQCKAMVPAHTGYKKVLVTGGAGFIGSHVALRLLDRGDDVVIVDEMNDHYDVRIKEANLRLLRDKYPSHERLGIYRGDISDADFMESIFVAHKPKWVCHMAARAGVRPSIDFPYVYIQSNIDGTTRLMERSHMHGVKNFVFASSSSVYGGSNSTFFSEEENVDNPISPYAASKKSAELFAYTYHHLYDLNITGLRFFTVYGPRGRPDMAPFMFVDQVSRGKPIDQFGDGSTSRDYTYILDIVNGVVSALDRPHKYEIINLGKGSGTSLNDFIHIVEKYTGKEARINVRPDQPGDVPYTCANITKAHLLLGYEAKVPIDEGIRLTVEWYNETYGASKKKKFKS